ncbi:MAG: DUF1987 domain-containing protein [Bacteroidota bacterium]
MDPLIIEATQDSPAILFDASTNHFIISGESRPENAGKFYTPVIDWVMKLEAMAFYRKQEMQDDSTLVFVFKLDYFNSTSAKYILDILLIIKKLSAKGYKTKVEWYYDKRGDDILDAGNEFSKMIDMKFDIIAN